MMWWQKKPVPAPPAVTNETVWAMSFTSTRQVAATGICSTDNTLCTLDGEPLQWRVWMRVKSDWKVFPTQNATTKEEATRLAMLFAHALQETYFAGCRS